MIFKNQWINQVDSDRETSLLSENGLLVVGGWRPEYALFLSDLQQQIYFWNSNIRIIRSYILLLWTMGELSMDIDH